MHGFRIRSLIEEWEFRHGRRLSLQELSQATAIKAQTLSAMSNPQGYTTNSRYIETLCRFFGVTPNDLFKFCPPLGPNLREAETTTEVPDGK